MTRSRDVASGIIIGTTANRPTGFQGQLYFDTTIDNLYQKNSTQWLTVGSVPSIPVSLSIKGAAGGAGQTTGGYIGGAGALSTGVLQILKSTTYTILVGAGGGVQAPNAGSGTSPLGGGGLAGDVGFGGIGGGYSGIFLGLVSQANSILIAGGGGGGAYEGATGGAGGGNNGAQGGAGLDAGGTGGSQTAGGAGPSGTTSGSALQGGRSNTQADSGGSGGGGGGYFGGGPGSNTNPGSAGGGGSGFISPTLITSGAMTLGGATNGVANSTGGAGSVVISYPSSFQDLTLGGGLVFTYSVTSGNKIYTFTSGTGTVTI